MLGSCFKRGKEEISEEAAIWETHESRSLASQILFSVGDYPHQTNTSKHPPSRV